MFFLKKKPLLNQNSANEANPREVAPVEENNAAAEAENFASTVETTGERPPVSGPVLFSKFLRNQKLMNGPEASYENEAWAPEVESVGLFRKHRAIVEEQPSSPSGDQ